MEIALLSNSFLLARSQIVLVPRINSLPIIPEEPSELWDPREFDANRCADIIYTTDKENLPEVCKKYYYSIGFWTFGGAHGL